MPLPTQYEEPWAAGPDDPFPGDEANICWKCGEECRECGLRMVPGLRISIEEVERAASFLRDHGWSGLISFDEAVASLVEKDDD